LNKIKLNNAYKWFKMAIKINPESKEAYIGVSISALKLGKYEECINFIEQRPG
jgi:tetratricopeptide (TPR) repeat protein